MHDPGRDLQRFAGKPDADERFERDPVVAAGIIEIGSRLVGKQHRLRIETVDQPAR